MTAYPENSRLEPPESEDKVPLSLRLIPFFDRYGILIVIAVMCLVMWALQPDVFLSWRNISNIFKQTAANGMLSIGMFVVILTAGIDLSVGSVLALGMMTLAVSNAAGVPWPVALALSPIMGMAAGFVNGIGITKLRMPHPFIMTLGMLFMARGLANLISGGVPYSGLPDPVRFLGSARIYLGELDGTRINLPVVFLFTILVYLLFWILLEHTVFGRRVYAIGGNPEAARVSGINVDRTLIIVYTICGFMAGIAGLIMAGRTNSGFPNAGTGMELEAIAAVIIGGASFFGGRGQVLGIFGGVLIMGLIKNGLNLNNVSTFWQQILIGAIIVLAVFIDVLRRDLGTRH
ncbi:MAG: ABC transporter permease [Albidovulum sp.]|nr:ABC transporter permease [Albidovulum sp.]MDE0530306.1 ABC transporter permease [Albidovulum sp.]